MNMRLKAMDSLLSEESPLAKGKAPVISLEERETEGMESMLVTPEEKAMILSMRGENPDMAAMNDSAGDDDESPGQILGA